MTNIRYAYQWRGKIQITIRKYPFPEIGYFRMIFGIWDGAVTCESLVSREFFSYFTSRSRSRGFSISLSLLEKSEVKNQFTFHFSKRVKREMISLFISRKKWKQFKFHSFFSREKKEWNQISATVNFCRIFMQNTTKCNKYRMLPKLNFHFLLFIPLF